MIKRAFIILISVCCNLAAFSQFKQPLPRDLCTGEIPVNSPGFYGENGKTYVLVKNISSDRSAIFLGKDITLDLNGYSITFADYNYMHVNNYSFENGFDGWDISRAPGARIVDTKVQVMVGDKAVSLAAGDEIVSGYVMLPVADRSYFAMCGVSAPEMKISIFVEDSLGNAVICRIKYGEEEIIACPAEDISPRLGGGITYAHISDPPAGRYRLRIRALTDCYIDYADIRPAGDVGIGIAEEIGPWINYRHLYNSLHGAFFDYAGNLDNNKPIYGLPIVSGKGTITIKNGTIKSGTEGILSWGIQSNAGNVTLILDNVKIENSGINTNVVDAARAVITNCIFDVKNSFIINRHGSDGYAVDLWGNLPSEVSYSKFSGGQGCLVFKGDFSSIHHNHFSNRQSVTNHYSIMAMGDSSLIYNNKIIPETGSGIEIYIHRGIEIFNNEIRIEAAPPTCEYGHSDYSTTAIRIADYNAIAGTSRAAYGNKVFNNRIFVTGKDYPDYPDYIPMAWALFYSSSGGENQIFGNEITVTDLTPGLKNETSAFYIGGGCKGGIFSGNIITSNVPSFWIASRYGSAEEIIVSENIIRKSDDAGIEYKPVRIGWYRNVAKNIVFRSNQIEGTDLDFEITDSGHTFSVYWTLGVRITDKKGTPAINEEIIILNAQGIEMERLKTGGIGYAEVELPEYNANGTVKEYMSPYTVITGREKISVVLNKNRELVIIKSRRN